MSERKPAVGGAGLDVRALAVTYGQHHALKGVDIQVAPGEIVVILGANGAGKTSLLKAVAGMVHADAASQVRLGDAVLTGEPPHRIVEAGLALVPEGRGIFGDLSVRENLLLGAFAHRARPSQDQNLQRVQALFPKLQERSAQLARTMSGGEQQMVAIGRALMSAPTILMLDEPSLGLSPLLCTELFRSLKAVRETGVGILLVEQNARQSLAIADRAYLLENGQIVGRGTAEQLARDPAVQAAYLGGAAGHAAAPAGLGVVPAGTSPRTSPRIAASPAMAASASPAAVVRSTLPAPLTHPSLTSPAPAAASGPMAAAQAAAAAALRAIAAPALQPSSAPGASTPADSLVPVRIADLVRVATQRQAEAVSAQRSPGAGSPELAARALAELQASGTLDAAIAGIHQAAARARSTARSMPTAASSSSVRPTSAVSSTGAPGTSGVTGSGRFDAVRPAETSGAVPTGPLAPLEIWRRPGLEIYRRQPDGTLKKEN